MSTLTITTIQSNIHWEDIESNLRMFGKKIDSINEKTELIILPEMFSTGFIGSPQQLAEPMDGTAMQWMKRIASVKKAALTGSIAVEDNGKYFNRLIWMLPNGQYGIYDKRHLFSYGGENKFFTAGNKRLIASLKGWRINLQICYDLRFPVWTRQQTKDNMPEYDILINVANWPDKRQHAWKTLLQARAIENMAYVFGVNRTGIDGNNIVYKGNTSVIDPLGNIIYQKEDVDDIFTITLKKENLEQIRNRFPFLDDADQFDILH